MSHANLTPYIRVGVFESIPQAEKAVLGLRAAGFRREQISVLCSDRPTERHFREFEHEEPAGFYTPWALAGGAATGACVGATAGLAISLLAGNAALLSIGIVAAAAGAAIGGFIGSMLTRYAEGDLADYYDQAVVPGKILVAVEDRAPRATERLNKAEQVLTEIDLQPAG